MDEGGGGGTGTWRAVFNPNPAVGEVDIVGPAIVQNKWTHVVMMWSLSGSTYTITLYLNGVSQGSTTWTGTPSASIGPLYIGTGGQSVNNELHRKMSTTCAYTLARSLPRKISPRYTTKAKSSNPKHRALALWAKWLFNEGTSTIAHDTSGKRKQNGTLSGSTFPVWTNGKHGKALSFNGTSSYVTGRGTNLPNLGASANVTVSAWVNPIQCVRHRNNI